MPEPSEAPRARPRVSVITAAYNAGSTLAETIASVRAQSLGDWEMIIANDHSTDDTRAVALGTGDPRVRVIDAERGRGPAAARNAALGVARGELVAILDADDRWLPDYLERQVGAYDQARARPASQPVGIVSCDAWLVVEGARTGERYLDRVRDPERPDVTRMLHDNAIFISTLVPRAVGEALGWFDETLFGVEDHDLWLRILQSGHTAVVVREPLVEYRVHPGSVSSDPGRMGANGRRLYDHALRRGGLSRRQAAIARRQRRYFSAVERVSGALAAPSGTARAAGLLRAAPLAARVVAENPGRWVAWLRDHGPERARGGRKLRGRTQ